jgi:hypothetical protein
MEAAPVIKSKTVLLAREKVLLNQHLLMQIFSCLVTNEPGSVATRKTLGACALVNKSWKNASRVDLLRRPVFTHLLPAAAEALSRQLSPSPTTRAESEYAQSFIRYGQLLAEMKKSLVDADNQLTMHVEIFDSRDQFRYLSAVGRLRMLKDSSNTSVVSVFDEPDTCCATNAFSVATRDPSQDRYATIQEYFHRAHETDSSARLCIRIVASHRGTGKSVMFLDVQPGCQFMGDGVAKFIQTKSALPLLASKQRTPELLDAFPLFCLTPVPGQSAEVSDREKTWQLRTDNGSFGFLITPKITFTSCSFASGGVVN